MDYCYVEFAPKDEPSLRRAEALLHAIKVSKESDERTANDILAGQLSESEQGYFWNPSPEEEKEWNDHWFSTPVDIRLSPKMLLPQWHFESMLDAFWNGEYDIIGIRQENGSHYLVFNPHSYPYGGTGCMVALLECHGHTVTGIEDGTGYQKYVRRTEFWRPKGKKPWQFWR